MRFRVLTTMLLTYIALTLTASTAIADDEDDLIAAIEKAEKLEKEARYDAAAVQYEKALKLAPRVFGENHANTTAILNNLAILYQTQGKYAEAEPLYLRSLAIREKVQGQVQPDVAISLNGLAGL